MYDMNELRRRREGLGVSQFRFARKIGVTSAKLSSWELGKTAPTARQIDAIEAGFRALQAVLDDGGSLRHQRRVNGAKGRARKVPPSPPVVSECCADFAVPPAVSDAPSAIALFSGCGGMARGFQDAGFEIRGYVEIVPEARATFRRNFPTAQCLGHDIVDVTDADMATWGGPREIDVIVGGPPCQGFSLAGKRDRNDPRNLLFQHLLRAARIVRPKFIVMENVRLLLSMKDPDGGMVIDRITAEMKDAGYNAEVRVLNAQDFGVPQFRERVFILAARSDLGQDALATFPTPAFGSRTTADQELFSTDPIAPTRTFRDATRGLTTLESGESDEKDPLHWAVSHPEHVLRWLRDVPEGGSAHENTDPALRPPSGYNTTYKRLRWDEPGSTIGTTFGMISASRNVHPEQTRSLTVREAARLQTFPDDFRFEGSWGAVRTMIGNAVPPMLAEAIACQLVKRLATDYASSGNL